MDLPTFLLLKLVLYTLALGAGAWRFHALGHPARALVLPLLAAGRVILGLALGVAALWLADVLPFNAEGAIKTAGIPLIGFGLWVAAGKLAYRTPPLAQLLAFAGAAEVVSLGLDFMMLSEMSKVIH